MMAMLRILSGVISGLGGERGAEGIHDSPRGNHFAEEVLWHLKDLGVSRAVLTSTRGNEPGYVFGMRRRFRGLGLLSWVLLLSWVRAEPAKTGAGTEKMMTREFKAAPEFMHRTSDDPRSVMIESAQERLEGQGITFPAGAGASFDVFGSTLSVTNTQGNLDLVEAFFDVLHDQAHQELVFGLTVVEGPGEAMRQMNAEASRSTDAGPALAALLKASGVRVVGEAFLPASSGHRATTRSVQEHPFPSGFRLDAKGQLKVDKDIVAAGLNLELEATVGYDGTAIDITGVLELNPEPATESQTWLTISTDNKPISLPLPRMAALRSTVNTSMQHGETRLLAIAAPPSMTPRGGPDLLWASFLTLRKVRLDMPPLVKAAGPAKPLKAAAGMQAAAMRVPVGLLENALGKGQTLQEFFEARGVPTTPGAEATVEGEVLSIVNTAANIERVAALIHQMSAGLPHTMALTLHTVQGSGAYLRELARQAAPLADHGKLWAEVERGAAAGEHALQITNTARIDCHPDAPQASLGSVTEHRHLASSEEGEKTQEAQPAFDVRDVGTTIQFSGDRTSAGLMEVSLNVATHSLPPPTRQGLLPVTDFRVQETTTRLCLPDGGTRLLSLARADGVRGEDTLQATFLRCDVSAQSARLRPVPEPPAPPRPANATLDAKPQYTRSYRVPPDFLSIDAAGEAQDGADPFKPGAEAGGVVVRRSAQEILEAAGIPFPAGASVHTGGATSQIVVRNTQENLDKVEAWVEEMIRETRPLPVVLTTQIIEAPAPLVRELMAGMEGRSDHRAELEGLLKLAGEGKASALATSRMETKPGTRCTDESGVEHSFLSDVSEDDKGGLSFATDTRRVGLSTEVELVLHKKRGLLAQPTVGITFHTARPSMHDEQMGQEEGRLKTFPLTDFHVMKLVTETIIPAGTVRVLAVWKPAGKTKDGAATGDVLQVMFVVCEVLQETR